MSQQLSTPEPQQLRKKSSLPIILMIAGLLLLGAGIIIPIIGLGYILGLGLITKLESGGFSSLSILATLSQPSIPGVMLFLIGLVNITQKQSLHRLRMIVTLLCSILLGLSVLSFLLLLALPFLVPG